jgi:alpha-galactosidase
MHGRLWANDPDCVIARQSRTKLSLAEVQTLATAIAMSGGAVLLSDDMQQLTDERLDLVSSILPPLPDEVEVNDLMRESTPSTMTIRLAKPFESWLLVARFNWDGRRRDLAVNLPPGRWHAFEFWERRYLGVHEGELMLPSVPAHGARLLSLRMVLDRPQVVGTCLHFSMGGQELTDVTWDEGARVLRIGLQPAAKREGAVFVHVPQEYQFGRATLLDETVETISDGEIVCVPLSVDRASRSMLSFTRAR